MGFSFLYILASSLENAHARISDIINSNSCRKFVRSLYGVVTLLDDFTCYILFLFPSYICVRRREYVILAFCN